MQTATPHSVLGRRWPVLKIKIIQTADVCVFVWEGIAVVVVVWGGFHWCILPFT